MSRVLSLVVVVLSLLLVLTQVSAGGKERFPYGGQVPAVPAYEAKKVELPGYTKSMPNMPNLPQLELKIEQLPEETMPEEYLEPVVETKFVDQDIIQKHHITRPIVRQVVVEQPIKRHRLINQPLIRKIIHQTVYRPHVHEQTTVKRPVYTQPIYKPVVAVQNTVKQRYSEEHRNEQESFPETHDSTNQTLYTEAGLQSPIVMQAPASERLKFAPSQGKSRFFQHHGQMAQQEQGLQYQSSEGKLASESEMSGEENENAPMEPESNEEAEPSS